MSAHTETPSPLDLVRAAHAAYNDLWKRRADGERDLNRPIEEARIAYVEAQSAYAEWLGKAES